MGNMSWLSDIEKWFGSHDDTDKRLTQIEKDLGTIMATLAELRAAVAAESTVVDSIHVLLDGIKKQLDDVMTGVVVPPAVQAQIDAIFADVETNKQKLSDAVVENTTPPAGG